MEIHISGRGVDVSAGLRGRIERKLGKAGRLLPKLTEARVVLSTERYRPRAEVTLHAKGATLRAEAGGREFFAALDTALESLEQQVRRRKERLRERKPRPARRGPKAAPLRPSLPEPVDEGPAVVVRRPVPKPMSVDEAIEQLRGRQDGFLVFTNAESRTLNVLRRRADGEIELVEPAG